MKMAAQMAELEHLLEAVPGALVGVDREGVIRWVNCQAEGLFGYDRDDLVGLPIETLVPESNRQEHPAHRERYLAGLGAEGSGVARASGVERNRILSPACLRGRQRDGTEFPVNITLSHTVTEDGLFVIAAVRDMTDQASSHEKHNLMSRLAAIVENSDDAIIGKTCDGIITTWNPAAERMFGYSGGEVIGRSIELLSPEGRTHEMKAILARIKEGRAVGTYETVRVTKNGTVVPVSLTVSPIRDAEGAVIGASSIARDVTEARWAFESARSMIEASLDSLVAISPEGRITDVNEATVKVTGVPRGELVGTDFSGYFTDPEKANRIYRMVFEQGMAVDYPLTMRHRDGTVTEVLYNASVYRDAGGNVLGVFAAARDVTKQVRAQREVAEQQARELERLDELERFQRLTVGRELKMMQLKREIDSLKNERP
jgi:PAS domain S-box-containing protein